MLQFLSVFFVLAIGCGSVALIVATIVDSLDAILCAMDGTIAPAPHGARRARPIRRIALPQCRPQPQRAAA